MFLFYFVAGTSNISSSGWDCKYRASGGGGRDYVAGTESALGVHSYQELFDTPLAKRWPSFGRLMSINSTQAGWASAADRSENGLCVHCWAKSDRFPKTGSGQTQGNLETQEYNRFSLRMQQLP
jgi:hypothetical protein